MNSLPDTFATPAAETPAAETSAAADPTRSRAKAVALPRFDLVVGLFLLSGATGLIDQLCFSKYLGYIVGATAYAVSAVLAAFMAGLALGAFLGGKFASRVRRPLVAYGVLEIVVALAVCSAPIAFRELGRLYILLIENTQSLLGVSVLRWALALVVVIVPTTAMGMTLPLLSRLVSAAEPEAEGAGRERERRLGALYAVNTLGGALGALGAAYWLLPAFGIATTLTGAGVLSGLVGVVAILAGLRLDPVATLPASVRAEAPASGSQSVTSERGLERVLLPVALASGGLVFACEVVFTHLLALIVGNSAYVFGLILAIFLICLFAGATLAPWVHQKLGIWALPLGLCAASLALALTLPLWDRLPLLFSGLGSYVTTFEGREAARGFVVFAVLALPTTLMGLTFPLVLQRVAQHRDLAHSVGRLTSLNTLGAVSGSLLTGYWVLPHLGSQGSLIAVLAVFAGAGLAVLLALPRGRLHTPLMLFAAVPLALALLLPRWDLGRLTAGTNVYFDGYEAPDAVLSVHEDVHGGVTTVARRKGIDFLYTNGKFQGNTGWEMEAQRNFAHYPSMFVEHFDAALVIGLGTGTTLGTLAAYPWKSLSAVDISPGIVAAAERFFSVPNLGVFSDPRVRVHIDDGRNFLVVQQRAFDAIYMELSSIWFAGAASLYSQEFYRVVRSRLKPGGVFQQWVQLHHMYPEDFAAILHTLRLEFKHTALFYGGGQGILVAADTPLVALPSRLRELQARPEIQRTLSGRPLAELFDDVLVQDEQIDHFIETTARRAGRSLDELRSTDDNIYLEYATPRGNVLPWETREQLYDALSEFRDPSTAERMRGVSGAEAER